MKLETKDRAGERAIDSLDIGAGAQPLLTLLVHQIEKGGALGLIQIEIDIRRCLARRCR